MSPEFVRYAPEIETIDPDIDQMVEQIIDFWVAKGRRSPTTEGTGRAVRGAHAKSYGLVKAEVEILADVPARPRSTSCSRTARSSSPTPHGTTCSSRRSPPTSTTTWRAAGPASTSPAAANAGKVVHREIDLGVGPDVYHPVLVDELRASSFDFDLQVQLCADLDAMPVNTVTVEWSEKLSPFVTVGRVHLPRQDIAAPENVEKGDALAFNQWRVTAEHRPLGEIMDIHRIYSASAWVRRTLNHQPQTEPVNADSVLPDESTSVLP